MPTLPVSVTNASTNPRAGLLGQGFIASQAAIEGQAEKVRKEIERLRSHHDDYDTFIEHWTFLLRAYEGGPWYPSADTLFKHQREHQDDYLDRLKRAHYDNYVQPIVDFVPEQIFKDPVDRDAGTSLTAEFERWQNNVDLAGADVSGFWREVAEDLRLFGKAYVQVDKLEAPKGVSPEQVSVLDAESLGLRIPYFTLVKPMEVLNWMLDRVGNYAYIKRVEYTSEQQPDMSIIDIERYVEFTKDQILISRVDVSDQTKPQLISQEQRPNAWGFVPFIGIVAKRSKAYKAMGLSAVGDIAYQNRHVFNLTSLIDEFLARQCFNILAVEKDTALPTREQVEGDIGTSNLLEVPRQASHFPAYVSPPVDPAQFIQSERASTIKEMYRQAAQDVASELFAVSNKSGEASKQAFGRTVPTIARLADTLQNAEVRAMRMWAKMQGKDDWDGKVAYRDDFSITNVQDLLIQLATIFNTLRVLSPTFIREEWKRVIREIDGRITHEQKEKIYQEIDAISDEELVEMYDTASDSQSAEDLPSTANAMQGKTQTALGTDRRISLASGNPTTALKESAPDANRRTKLSSARRKVREESS